jgi:hypothetical protein
VRLFLSLECVAIALFLRSGRAERPKLKEITPPPDSEASEGAVMTMSVAERIQSLTQQTHSLSASGRASPLVGRKTSLQEDGERRLFDRLDHLSAVQSTGVDVGEKKKRFASTDRQDPRRMTQPITLQEVLEADA